MMVPLCHHQPSLSAKPLPTPIFSPFPIPRTFVFQNPNRPKSQIRSSSSADTKTIQSSAIQRIAEKLRSLGFSEEDSTPKSPESYEPAGEIFVPLPNQLPRFRVGHTIDTSWSTPDFPVPEPGSGRVISRYQELRRAWKKEVELERKKEEKVPTLAELTLSASELRRLRKIGIELKKKLKIGKAGITEGIVNGIHERWRNTEVVKIFCEDISMMNMKRTHEVLEKKTGGLVIWRSGSKILLYRGPNYQYPYFDSDSNPAKVGSSNATSEILDEEADMENSDSSGTSPTNITAKPAIIHGVGSRSKVRFQLPGEAQMVEEADKLLEGLGPRFTDWWAYDPLPVDADLLPAIIPGYRRPFRLLPYGVSPKLTGDELTILRRLGRPLPCHFALGRNRKLHGLAAAIVKLWEKCEIAKIAVKRGVQNSNSDMMAEELKWLTGGTLLSRDKDFIVLYRGKDFLPSAVSSAIEERRKHLIRREEEQSANLDSPSINKEEPKLGDSVNDSQEEVIESNNDINRTSKPKSLRSPEAAIERTSFKLSMALEKKAKAEKLLAELEQREIPKESDVDREGITKEEKFMLRKVGLRMKPFLLLGRRGVFDGTIENMHLHWKYRELVKIICKEQSAEESRRVARILESESGGILVAVERVSKGYAIIVYRGKNYERPASLRPRTLLSKREAMKRSLEAQRRQSLKLHVLKLTRSIDQMNRQLVKDDNMDGDMQLNADSRIGLDITKTEVGFDDQNFEVVDEDNYDMTSREDEMGLGISSEHDRDAGDSSGYTDGSEESDCDDTESCQSSAGIILSSTDKSAEILSQGEIGCKDDINAEHCDSTSRVLKLSDQQTKCDSRVSGVRSVTKGTGSLHLSNRQRLILRKQALKMKKRAPLSVGRSNVVTGLAKAITTHFQKYPLAIVNVKGRAKGTSVQEVVSKLTEATGAFLVSQEPSKVILYRGWGAGIEDGYNNNIRNTINLTSEDRNGRVFPPVSPELMEAIRIECGLLDHHDQNTS